MSREENIKPHHALAIDVDGSLLKTDMLLESFWAALGRHPWLCLRALGLLFKKAAFKARLAELAALDVALLPVRDEVLSLGLQAQEAGRVVVLASGSDRSQVAELSEEVGIQAAPMASDGRVNLTGAQKAMALTTRFGEKGFDYVGDSRADLPVWQAATGGYLVAAGSGLKAKVQGAGLALTDLGTPPRAAALLKSMRPHQWVKNILLFLPLVAAHRFDMAGFSLALWGIAVFSAAASSIYIVNDLMDLAADRQHPTKKNRPFAAGEAKIIYGMGLMLALGALALGGSALHSWQLASIIALYMLLSLSYSLGLKRLRWVDISVLAALYTLRVVAGSVVVGVPMSGWLGGFVFPVFLALGAVKRLIELGKATNEDKVPGRGYARQDRADLRNVAITASVGAIVVYLLYTYSEIAVSLYQNLFEIRIAAITVALWLARMIYRGWHGRMNYDPIVFALRDPIGLALMGLGGFLLVHATG